MSVPLEQLLAGALDEFAERVAAKINAAPAPAGTHLEAEPRCLGYLEEAARRLRRSTGEPVLVVETG
jgi:hypothetical protein